MKIAFIFAGQGAQYVNMGKEFYENIACSKKIFDEADSSLEFPISKLCFEGPAEELNKTENTQPAILTTSIAALRALEEYDIHPSITAGLSLGEYAAHVCSGSLDFVSALKLVKKRGRFMQEAVPQGLGTMAAILGLEGELVREACIECSEYGIVEVANYNCPGQIVIGGEVEAVNKASEKALEKGAKRAIPLTVSGPFHTSMLIPAAEKLEEELKYINFSEFKIPVITNINGDFIKQGDNIKDILKNQVKSSVHWEETIIRMINEGIDTFVEIGPGKTLSAFVKKIDRKVMTLNVEDMKSLQNTVAYTNLRLKT